MATSYSLEYVSANVDVSGLMKGLKRSRKGNICFYGPPGTGKTALGQYIAEHLEQPLMVRRASDLLSMWLGETEQNIAEMFREARDENGMLLLDEANSFLRDRRGADHSWEVTQVNELLVQMENFDGLFICSTNLMDDLDQASLRRFAIKVQFDYLKPDQAWKMLRKECVGKATDKDRWAIIAMRNLAPGDFAAAKKTTGDTGPEGNSGCTYRVSKRGMRHQRGSTGG
ncbi:MAG: ATP-binding protein, partial [Mariprofundaceae bacterium]|nr:ATP-binding protein [Mariprofundaceae bacterium]